MEHKEAKVYKNRRYVSFSKRRSGLFSKGKDFCKKFEAEIGIVVLSEAGRPYWSPDNPSLDAVLDRFMQSDQAPTNAIDFKIRLQKNRKREEPDNEVQGQLAEEVKSCRTVKDMFSLRDKYLVLLQDHTNKRMKGSHVFECDRLNKKNDGGDNNISFWDKILEEGKSECVSFQPISESEDFLYNPSLNFESDNRGFDHYQGDNNSGAELCWNEEWEHGKVECVKTQPISKSEDIWTNTTPNFENNHDHVHGGNNIKDDEGCLLDLDKTREVIKETNHPSRDPIEHYLVWPGDDNTNNYNYEVDGVSALRGMLGSTLDFARQNPNPNPNPNPNNYYSYLENLCNEDTTFDYLL
ncbi:hypothetical protein L3X38_021728 [Prunus dulcis]|uniref:MADS-box domain-containing protein n=1 Tax=Prunus dulcis TaxID=3755 RepID=A0AAD4VWI7_PRUDU|nr:hypothetical protein L3X38_021728 [Prunus dulcis]